MWRNLRLTWSPWPRMAVGRWQSSGADYAAAAATPSTNASEEVKKVNSAAPVRTPGAGADRSSPQSAAASDTYRFPADEVLDAMKKRDFSAVQTHATRLVQSRWREGYNVPAACVVIFVVMWYWIAWTRRSIRRKCEATEASTRQQTEEMVKIVRDMTEKWNSDMAKANRQMQGIIDKNSELTRDIDRMTTALRSCSIRPTAASSSAMAPTVSSVKRGAPLEEGVFVEGGHAAAAESSELAAGSKEYGE